MLHALDGRGSSVWTRRLCLQSIRRLEDASVLRRSRRLIRHDSLHRLWVDRRRARRRIANAAGIVRAGRSASHCDFRQATAVRQEAYGRLSREQLAGWYGRHGFAESYPKMVRSARSSADCHTSTNLCRFSTMPEDRAASFLQMIRRSQRGRLKIYLGYGPGVGKTYQMLQEAHRLKDGRNRCRRRLCRNPRPGRDGQARRGAGSHPPPEDGIPRHHHRGDGCRCRSSPASRRWR